MAKRRLSEQQKRRISAIQTEKRRRNDKRDQQTEKLWQQAEKNPANEGLVIAHFGVTLQVEGTSAPYQGQLLRCHRRANLPKLVTGDRIIWHMGANNEGVIVALCERHSLLTRPDIRGQLKPVAANIDQIFIIAAPSPRTALNLIDRYLVAAYAANIPPIIVINKQDLLEDNDPLLVELPYYQQLGYQTLILSAQQQDNLMTLHQLSKGKTSIFVGQSGVGKSTLVNQLFPEVQTKTNLVSQATGKGQHTTTTATLYHGDDNCHLIDSPGIREFGLWHVDTDTLLSAFVELEKASFSCKFRNCKHENEPGCALLKAVEAGVISQRRIDSYKAIRNSLDEVEMK